MTLTAMALGRMNWARQVALVLGGSLFIAMASQVSVPFYPVPMTLQTFAILTVGFAFGARLGLATVAVWLMQGAMGAPVFSNFGNGAAFFGPTAGFLVGFLGLAYLAGLAVDRGLRHPLALAGVGIVASLLLYLPGLAWPLGVAQAMGLQVWGHDLALPDLLGAFMTPFLIGDAIKAVLAALVVGGAMSMLRNRA